MDRPGRGRSCAKPRLCAAAHYLEKKKVLRHICLTFFFCCGTLDFLLHTTRFRCEACSATLSVGYRCKAWPTPVASWTWRISFSLERVTYARCGPAAPSLRASLLWVDEVNLLLKITTSTTPATPAASSPICHHLTATLEAYTKTWASKCPSLL